MFEELMYTAQFERAVWYENDRKHGRSINVEIASEREMRTDFMQNVICDANTVALRTAYSRCAFKPQQEIRYRGKWWTIITVRECALDINPQARAILRNPPKQYVLEMAEVGEK